MANLPEANLPEMVNRPGLSQAKACSCSLVTH